MDSTVSTGAAALMAIRVLLVWVVFLFVCLTIYFFCYDTALFCTKINSRSQWIIPEFLNFLLIQDHDVEEDKIFLLSLLMAEMGVHSVAYAFPKVRIITTAVDKKVNDEFHIIPGIGTIVYTNEWSFRKLKIWQKMIWMSFFFFFNKYMHTWINVLRMHTKLCVSISQDVHIIRYLSYL